MNFTWDLCNKSDKGIKANVNNSFVKFEGPAVIKQPFDKQKVKVEGAPNWQGNVKPGTCRKIIAKVMVDRCKPSFDSEVVIKYPGRNGATCTEKQSNDDWILRRCSNIFVSFHHFRNTTIRSCLISSSISSRHPLDYCRVPCR